VSARGENHSGYLDDASIKSSTVQVSGQQREGGRGGGWGVLCLRRTS
jgi:hypothetical protein